MSNYLDWISVATGTFFGLSLMFGYLSSYAINDQTIILTGLATIASLMAGLFAIADVIEKNFKDNFDKNIRILFEDIKKTKMWERWSFLKRKEEILLDNGQVFTGDLSNPELKYRSPNGNIVVNLPTTLLDCFELPVFEHHRQMLNNEMYFINYYLTKSRSKKKMDYVNEYRCVMDILFLGKNMVIARCLKEGALAVIMSSAGVAAIALFLL